MTDPAAEAGIPGSGLTPREIAKRYRVSPEKVRTWIERGELGALNLADAGCGKPRYVVLPQHLAAFERRRQVSPPPRPQKRRRRVAGQVDYFPDN